jgi:phage N-6-adenine-methyltransferase
MGMPTMPAGTTMSASPMRLPGIGSHHSANPQTDEWLTPRHVIESLRTFDLDPCASAAQTFPTAARHLIVDDDGLSSDWAGHVWLNPPYSAVATWIERLADHDDGVALVFARTEVRWWFEHVWPQASALLFLKGRLTFHRADGAPTKKGHNSGGPSVLIGYGDWARNALVECPLPGALILDWYAPVDEHELLGRPTETVSTNGLL